MPKFPFTNYHELNLDWILKKVEALFDASEENARTIRTYDSRLNSAEQTATSAATAATSAQQLANAAAANADNALSVAGTADQKADSALTAATDASSAVSGALTAAQEAQQTAGAAVATANDAAATAASLESLANTANQNATAAMETAGTANQNATAAVETAGTANQNATAAQTAANTADQKAVAAQQTANSAQSAAATNAGNITALQTNVTDLNRQISGVEAFIDWSVITGTMVRASDGKYVDSSPYNSYEYPVYGLSKVFLTPYFTNATYGYAFYDKSKNFISNSGGTYEVATRTEITVPDGAYYIRFTENIYYSKPKLEADWGLLLETKADIESTKTNSAEVYADVYDSTDYIPTDGLSIVGKYYDTSGRLQTASNMSTTGIIDVPYGIKDIYYNAFRNISIPTILFFDSDMQIVGTVIATVAPVYGDTSYFGYAEIPSTAKFMEFSMNNTITGQIVTVRYSKVDNNSERIKILETDPLYGKKITCTGDSITSAIHSVPNNGYVAQIANAHGMTIDNQAIWGAVFPQNKSSGGEPKGCIYDTIALMDASADIVIISGGINDAEYYASDSYWGAITEDYDDALDTETFCGALEAICKTALQKWSGKPIIFVFEHRMTLDNTTYGAHFNDVQYPLMIDILKKWGIPFVDLYHDMPSLSYNEGYKEAYTTGDGVHPNIEGYAKFYVPRVYSKIKEVMCI